MGRGCGMSAENITVGVLNFKRSPRRGYCKHIDLTYSTEHETVFCNACESYISPFVALLSVVTHIGHEQDKITSGREWMDEQTKQNLHLIAAKSMEKAWRSKRLPCCPHCMGGITAESMKRPTTMSDCKGGAA